MDAFKIKLLTREFCEAVSNSKTSIENLPTSTQHMHINSRKDNRRYLHKNIVPRNMVKPKITKCQISLYLKFKVMQ